MLQMRLFKTAIFLFALWTVLAGLTAVAQETVPSTPQEVALDQANAALIEILNDPDSRAALIEQLRKSSARGAGSDAAESVPGSGPDTSGNDTGVASENPPPDSDISEAPPAVPPTFASRVGAYTNVVVDQIRSFISHVQYSLNGVRLLLRGELSFDLEEAQRAVLQTGAVLLAGYIVYMIGQVLLRRTFRQNAAWLSKRGGFTRAIALLLTTCADGLIVLVSWSAGNLVAAATPEFFFDEAALDAFLIAGIAVVCLRFLFAPYRREVRPFPFTDKSSIYWSRRLGVVSYWTAYGVLFLVPLANLTVSYSFGGSVRFLVVLIAAVALLGMIFANRERVAQGVQVYADGLQSTIAKSVMYSFGHVWHLVASLYVLAVLFIWVVRPFDADTIVLEATGYSVLTIVLAVALSLALSRAIENGIRLPRNLQTALPTLEDRLNTYVPSALKVLRSLLFVVTILVLLDIWQLIDIAGWLHSSAGAGFMSRYSSALLVLLIAFVFWLALVSWVDAQLQPRPYKYVTARKRTLFQLFKNAATVLVIVMAALQSLAEVGVDIAPLIAGAGVVGLAISFGAQTLVKDIITGAFIQIENAINDGDVVTVAGVTGTVERLTVRSVRIRDLDGTTHVIPFSSVDMVSNFMRGFSYHVAVIGVSYDTDIEFAKEAMFEAFRRLKAGDQGPKIFDDLEMHGVIMFGASSVDIRARIKTSPGDQWAVGRAYNEAIKAVFDERDIEIPFPQITYHAAQPPGFAKPAKANTGGTAATSSNSPKDDAPPDED